MRLPPVSQFCAIARLAALETIRRPVFLLVSLSVLSGILLLPFLLHYTLGESARIIRDSALAFFFVGGLLLGAQAAGESLSRDLRRGTAASILATPVPRPLFFLAKATGLAVALGLFSMAALAATLLAVRAGTTEFFLDWSAALPAWLSLLAAPACAGAWNRRTRRPFPSAAFFLLLLFLGLALAITAGFPTPFDHLVFPRNLAWSILPVGFLLFLCLCMFTALAAALATRLPPSPVLLLITAIFLAGLMADTILGPLLDTSVAARTLYGILPNVQAFWLLDALDASAHIPPAYLATAAAYAAAWSAASLLLGCLSFHRLEIS